MNDLKPEDKPVQYILSREQLQFLKETRQYLLDFYKTPINEDNYDNEFKEHLIIEALLQLPITEQNLYIMKIYGNYPTFTKLADELQISKLTICNHIKKTKIYITKYVNEHFHKLIMH